MRLYWPKSLTSANTRFTDGLRPTESLERMDCETRAGVAPNHRWLEMLRIESLTSSGAILRMEVGGYPRNTQFMDACPDEKFHPGG